MQEDGMAATPEFGGQPVAEPQMEMAVAGSTISILDRTKGWVLMLSILSFTGAALMVLAGLVMGLAGLATQKMEYAVVVFTYPVFGLAYLFPAIYLYRYWKRIRELKTNPSPRQLDSALDAQRGFWKMMGILTIAIIVGSLLLLIFVVVLGVVAALKQQRF